MNLPRYKVYWPTALLIVGLTTISPVLAQNSVPSSSPGQLLGTEPLVKPFELCFDDFQRLTTSAWVESTRTRQQYTTYSYRLLLQIKEHIGRQGDIFVYYQHGGNNDWFLDGKSKAWVHYVYRDDPQNLLTTFYSGKLSQLNLVTITLPAEVAADWEKNAVGQIYIGYGLRETPTATANDAFAQMTSERWMDWQHHRIWDSSDLFNQFPNEGGRICMDENELRVYFLPLDVPSSGG